MQILGIEVFFMRFDINLWFKQSFLVLLFFSITQIWACGSENKSRGSERRVSSKAKNETTKDLPEITKAEDNDAEKNNEGLCTEKNPCGKCKSWKLIDGEDQHFDPKSHRIGQNCGNNLGVCSFGKWACLNEKEQSVIFCQGNIKAKKESCDNLDNDCDGKTDESFSRKNYYLDKDYDGYGDGNSWIKSCFQPKWHVENDTDCNDNNKLINPSVKENCLDKVDNNCNGKLDLEDSFVNRILNLSLLQSQLQPQSHHLLLNRITQMLI